MSRRQHERTSRFRLDIEEGVRAAAIAFRDNDVEASTETVIRLWWTSRLRGRRFAQLLQRARHVTQSVSHSVPSRMATRADAKRCPTSSPSCANSPWASGTYGGMGRSPPSPTAPYPSAFGTRS